MRNTSTYRGRCRRRRARAAVRALLLAAVLPCIVLLPMPARSQGSLVRVLKADSLVARSIADIQYRELIGHVIIEHDNVHITCNRALQNLNDNEVELNGDVVIRQDTLVLRTRSGRYNGNSKVASSLAGLYLSDGRVSLTADRGRYETGARRADFHSHVVVRDSGADIRAGSVVFHRDSSLAIATDSVRVSFPGEHALVTGDTVMHFMKRRVSVFPSRPRLWQIDTAVVRRDSLSGAADSLRVDTLSIVARHMEAYRDSTSRFLADGDVAIVRATLSAICDAAAYLRRDSMMVLRGAPVLWQDRTQITGDSVAVFLANGGVRRLSVIGNAFSISQSSPAAGDTLCPPGRYDQAKGAEIHLFLSDNDPDSARIETHAQSLYYLYDDRALNGVRRESGDRILLGFEDGAIATVRSIGGVEGAFYPEKMVTGVEHSYDLEGFVLRNDRPLQPPCPQLPPINAR